MAGYSEDASFLVHQTLVAWAKRDLEGTLRHMAPDIDYFVNVDGEVAPYATSSKGQEALRQRLQLMLDTFHFDAFVSGEIRDLPDQPGVFRVPITYYYREKTTDYRLDGRFRLVFEVRDGVIVRVEELHDSRYQEAFARLIRMLKDRREART